MYHLSRKSAKGAIDRFYPNLDGVSLQNITDSAKIQCIAYNPAVVGLDMPRGSIVIRTDTTLPDQIIMMKIADTPNTAWSGITGDLSTQLNDYGFYSWDGVAPYWSMSAHPFIFTLEQSGNGYILGTKITFASAQTVNITDYVTNYIYVDNTGTLQVAIAYSDAIYNNIMLFEVYSDGTNYFTVKENHGVGFDHDTSLYLHKNINTVISQGVGGDLAINTASPPKANIINNFVIDDHGLSSNATAQTPVTLDFYYTDTLGRYVRFSQNSTIPCLYNNAGVIASLSINKFNAYRIYVTKDNLNTTDNVYIALINNAEYATLGVLQTAIANQQIQSVGSPLSNMELCQLGYIILSNPAGVNTLNSVVIQKTTLGSTTSSATPAIASLITTDVSNFDRVLSATDTNIQLALDTIDENSARLNGTNTFASGVQIISDATPGTDRLSGALQVAGNIGCAKSVYANYLYSDLSIFSDHYYRRNAGATALSIHFSDGWLDIIGANHTLKISDNASSSVISGSSNVGANLTLESTSDATKGIVTTADVMTITNPTLSTSTTTGALQVVGGISTQDGFYASTKIVLGTPTVDANAPVIIKMPSNTAYAKIDRFSGSGVSFIRLGDENGVRLFDVGCCVAGQSQFSIQNASSTNMLYLTQTSVYISPSSYIITGSANTSANSYHHFRPFWSTPNVIRLQSFGANTGASIAFNNSNTDVVQWRIGPQASSSFKLTDFLNTLDIITCVPNDGLTLSPFTNVTVTKPLLVTDTTDTSAINTGALQISGGCSISKRLFIGNATDDANSQVIIRASSDTTAELKMQRYSVTGKVYMDFATSSGASKWLLGMSTTSSDIFNLYDSQNGRSVLSVDMAGQMKLHPSTTVEADVPFLVTNTTESTSIITGSAIISGGLGISKNVYVGGNANIAGNMTISTYVQNPVKSKYFWFNTNSGANMPNGTYYPENNVIPVGKTLTCEVGDTIEVFFNVSANKATTGTSAFIECEVYIDAILICNGIDQIADTSSGSTDHGNASCRGLFIATGVSHVVQWKFSSVGTCLSFDRGINIGYTHYKGSNNVTIESGAI